MDELDAARDGGPAQLQLQRALLPARLPADRGAPADRALPPGRGAGPDRRRLVRRGADGRRCVALVVGDVAGADLAAAALTAQLRGAVRAYTLEGHSPAAVVTRANEFHLGLDTGRLATLAYALVHPIERIITVVRAGHVPPLLAAPEPGPVPARRRGRPAARGPRGRALAGGDHAGRRRAACWRCSPTGCCATAASSAPRRGCSGCSTPSATARSAARTQLADTLAGLVHAPAPDDTVLLVGAAGRRPGRGRPDAAAEAAGDRGERERGPLAGHRSARGTSSTRTRSTRRRC